MNITGIKRKLAQWGIGDPLNQLFYSSSEIERMKRKGQILDLEQLQYHHKRKLYLRTTGEYLVGFSPNLLYSLDDEKPSYTEAHYVELMTERDLKNGLRNGNLPRGAKIFRVNLEEVNF